MKLLSALFLITSSVALAQTKAPPKPPPAPASRRTAPASSTLKIGVVQVERALFATNDGKKAIAAMNAEFESRKNDLAKKKSAIGDLQLRLDLSGDKLSPSDRDNLTQTIEVQTRDLNRLVDDMQADVQQEEQKIIAQLGQKLVLVVQKYALANGFTFVVGDKAPLVYFAKPVDITADIVSLYDKSSFTEPAAPAGKK